MHLLVLTCTTDIVCGLPVGSWSKFLGVLEEQDGAVVGVSPFRPSIEYTSSSCHTPAVDATE